jgi:hypothetical protein
MDFQSCLKELQKSPEFIAFKKENISAYLCSGFFVIDAENDSGNKQHFDFLVPESKKTFSFEMENGIRLAELSRGDNVLDRAIGDVKFDFEQVKTEIFNEMMSRNIKNKIQKMIFSLQNVKEKDMLLGTVFISGLGILRADFDISEKKITNFEKKSFFDMLKIVKGKA